MSDFYAKLLYRTIKDGSESPEAIAQPPVQTTISILIQVSTQVTHGCERCETRDMSTVDDLWRCRFQEMRVNLTDIVERHVEER